MYLLRYHPGVILSDLFTSEQLVARDLIYKRFTTITVDCFKELEATGELAGVDIDLRFANLAPKENSPKRLFVRSDLRRAAAGLKQTLVSQLNTVSSQSDETSGDTLERQIAQMIHRQLADENQQISG